MTKFERQVLEYSNLHIGPIKAALGEDLLRSNRDLNPEAYEILKENLSQLKAQAYEVLSGEAR